MDEDLRDEENRLRRLRFIVDFALQFIKTQTLSHDQALSVVEDVRNQALRLFPGKEDAFDIIYAPRFKRVLNDKFKRS
jgi:hypothetical protein